MTCKIFVLHPLFLYFPISVTISTSEIDGDGNLRA